MIPGGLRKWLAIGTGVGIEIRGEDLHAVIAKVRPSGVDLLSAATIEKFRDRPAAEWGAEFAAVLRKRGATHLPAHILLPRDEVIVRQVVLPGVTDQDLQAAVRFQIDALHPYGEDDVLYSAARVGGTSTVLIGITRRDLLENYLNLFTGAGIKVASFTFSAAAIYSALRLVTAPPAAGFLALQPTGEGVEAYGESEARPVFSASFAAPELRARAMAASELRLPPESEPVALLDLLPYPRGASRENEEYHAALSERALPYATALAGACPRLALPLNLLPDAMRASVSRLLFVPTMVLSGVLAILLVLAALQGAYQRSQYLATVNAEIAKLQSAVNRASALDKSMETARKRTKLLDEFRRRSKNDMDAINELTHLLPPPAWLSQLDLTRTTINISGEAEQAAPLLKQIDNSKLFEDSEFTMPMARVTGGEAFRIRASREGVPKEGPSR
jgi:Tfp pilus assembly protein PilN